MSDNNELIDRLASLALGQDVIKWIKDAKEIANLLPNQPVHHNVHPKKKIIKKGK